MTSRSTRNKLKHQGDKLITSFNRQFEHLKLMQELSEGESPYIETYVPIITQALEYVRKSCIDFREGL